MDRTIQIEEEELQHPIAAILSEPELTITSNGKGERYIAVMVHGFPSNSKAHGDFFGELQQIFDGYAIPSLRFDFHGCGKSEGRVRDFCLTSAGNDLKTILRWVQIQGYQKILLIGEGLGAWLALANMTEAVKMLLLFWPVMDPKSYAIHNFPVANPQEFEDEDAYMTFDDLNIGVKFLKELHATTIPVVPELNIPVMVQHGVKDDIVPIEHLDILKEHIVAPRLDLTSYQDGQHGLIDERHRKMIEFHIGQFLERYTGK